MTPRLKTKEKQPIPTTYEEANGLLARWAELESRINEIGNGLAVEAAVLKAKVEGQIKPLRVEQKLLALGLEAYAEVHRKELLKEGGKSHDMPAGRIGWRNRPPSVELRKGHKVDDVIAALREMRLVKFLRRTWSINKEAMLDDPERAATVPGIRIKDDEEAFYFTPAGMALSDGEP